MTRRDITSTEPQGSRFGPRPDQLPHVPNPDAPASSDDVDNEVDENDDPVVDVDDLGAAVEGDGERAVDATRGKRLLLVWRRSVHWRHRRCTRRRPRRHER